MNHISSFSSRVLALSVLPALFIGCGSNNVPKPAPPLSQTISKQIASSHGFVQTLTGTSESAAVEATYEAHCQGFRQPGTNAYVTGKLAIHSVSADARGQLIHNR